MFFVIESERAGLNSSRYRKVIVASLEQCKIQFKRRPLFVFDRVLISSFASFDSTDEMNLVEYVCYAERCLVALFVEH